jgi:preprotein translocase subunit SecF
MSTTPTKRSIWYRLYHGETAVDFVGRKRTWFLVSTIVILIGIGSLALNGLNFGIDFEGGTSWEVKAPGVSVAQARDAMRPLGLGDAKIQVVGGDLLRVQGPNSDQAERDRVTEELAKLAAVSPDDVALNEVGPSWGTEITRKAFRALIFFFLAIALYISLRFEWKMALAALSAVVHDILITVGIYSLSRFEVTPATVVAFLTILGYSLYDTIVVFDKVEENTRGLAASGRLTYGDTVNLSMNQVLMRSLNTSLVALLPILSVLVVGSFILGATSLQDFGLALFIGLATGAYSSIFIAAPILAVLKEREPRYATIRQRVLAKGATATAPLTPAAAAAGGLTVSAATSLGDPATEERPTGGPRPATARPQGNRPAPRPRKKGKRR